MYYKTLIGENLYFSPLDVENDYKLFTKWENDPTLQIGYSRLTNCATEQSAKEKYTRLSKNYYFEVIRKEDDKPIGIYHFNFTDSVFGNGMVGGFLDQEMRGKGYGTEALRMICDFGFNALNLHTIGAYISSKNVASLRSAEKVGFKEVGKLKEWRHINGKRVDEVIVQITRDEFNKKHSSFVEAVK